MSLLSPCGCSEPRNWSPSTGLLVLRRRMVAELYAESLVESCGNDVGDVLVVELEEVVGDPGDNNRHAVFRVAQYFLQSY